MSYARSIKLRVNSLFQIGEEARPFANATKLKIETLYGQVGPFFSLLYRKALHAVDAE